jgi:hypothetical protein
VNIAKFAKEVLSYFVCMYVYSMANARLVLFFSFFFSKFIFHPLRIVLSPRFSEAAPVYELRLNTNIEYT